MTKSIIITFAGLVAILITDFLPGVSAAPPPIYVCYFAHVEESRNVQSLESYLKERREIRLFAEMMAENGVAFNLQPDWTFLSEVGLYDSGPVVEDTNGKNLIRYFNEDLGTAIDPHGHEVFGHNYADIAYLIESLGVTPSPVVGGFLYAPPDNYQNWERFFNPLSGTVYPWYSWSPSILCLGATAGHTGNDDSASGCWRMDSMYYFYRHASGSSLINVGVGGREYEILLDLLAHQEAGLLDEEKFYSFSIAVPEQKLKNPILRKMYREQIDVLNQYVYSGRLIWATIEEMAGIWQDEYGGEPNIYRHRFFPVIQSGDYNGDGTTDVALFRKSMGLWCIRGITRAYFGAEGDLPVSGDYNGDGSTDIALFRGSSGLWAVRGITRLYFGVDSDRPVPGDYNGDGTCDPGIYREGYGLWAIRGLTRSYFGGYSEQLVPGDYNGDGSCDIAVYRPVSGLWAIKHLSRLYFGSEVDDPAPGDYDGDSTTEAAIFCPSTGLWAIRNTTRAYFGTIADTPIRGDFKGTGLDSPGIFRGSSGLWAIRSLTRTYFGVPGDIPATR